MVLRIVDIKETFVLDKIKELEQFINKKNQIV
jgi:hypothetical protein